MLEKMPEVIEGFSQIEYLLIFNAIVFGAIASEYFSGWGAMLRNRASIVFSPLQFVWTIFAFMLLVQNWFGIWPRSKFINDGIGFFYFSLIPMLLFYLISVVLFPQMKVNTIINFKEHYAKNARALYILFGLYLIFTIIGASVYQEVDRGDVFKQNAIRIAGILLCAFSAYYSKKKWLHVIFLILNFIGILIFTLQIPK
jgi:hypothetical protein